MEGQSGLPQGSAFGFPAAAASSSSPAGPSSDSAFRPSAAPRGRGAAPRGWRGGASMRGAVRPQFGNRSAVFNNADPTSTAATTTQVEQSSPGSFQQPINTSAFASFAAANTPLDEERSDQLIHEAKEDDQFYSYDEAIETPLQAAAAATTQVNALGGAKESDDDRKRRFENLPKQNRFFELRTQREALRSTYIREGVLPDPDKPTDLAEAKALMGSCMEMCPEFEREEREFQNEGDVLEMFPGTQRIDPRLAVKIYRRPAAGRELPLPEDVRPPEVLCKTLDYLLHTLLPSDPSSPTFTAVQPFMWNRTRAIRQDFIVQGDGNAMAIECHERIARYHILCLHWRGGVGAEGWSEQQELEQLRKTIRSLTEFYEDMRRKQGIISPNEAEFRSYNLLLHMQDPETLREVEALPDAVFQSDAVHTALKLRAYAQRSNNLVRRGRPRNTEATMNLWTRFFSLLRRSSSVTYLLACLAENTFSQVRAGALKAMGKTYLSQHAPLPLDYLERSLGLDSQEQALEFALALGAEEAFAPSGELLGVRLGKVNDEKPLPAVPFSKAIVEAKRGTLTCQAVVDGITSHAAPTKNSWQQKPVVPAALPTRVAAASLSPFATPFATSTTSQVPAQRTSAALSNPAAPKTPALPSAAAVPAPFASSSPAPAFTFGKASAAAFQSAPQPSFAQTPRNIPAATAAPEAPQMITQSKPFGNQSVVFNNSALAGPPAALADAGPPKEERKRSVPVRFDLPSAAVPAPQGPPLERRLSPHVDPPPIAVVDPDTIGTTDASASPERKEAALPAKAAAPLVTKQESEEERKRRFNSRLEAVTQDMLLHVLQDAVQRKVRVVGEQACLREARLRHSKARERFVGLYAQQLAERLLGDLIDDETLSCASDALAKETAARRAKTGAFQQWRAALSRVRERARQTARLHKLRAHLEVRKPSAAVGRSYEERSNSGERDRALRGQSDRDLLVALSTPSKRRRPTDVSEAHLSSESQNGKRRTMIDLTDDDCDDDDEGWGEVANAVEQIHQRAIAKSRRIGSGSASRSTPTPRDALLRSTVAPLQSPLPQSPFHSSPSLAALRNVIDSAKQMLSAHSD